jgi:hypothetical protein
LSLQTFKLQAYCKTTPGTQMGRSAWLEQRYRSWRVATIYKFGCCRNTYKQTTT